MLEVRQSKMGITHSEATAAKTQLDIHRPESIILVFDITIGLCLVEWAMGIPVGVLAGLDMAGLMHDWGHPHA